jgi:ketosteroid isomerase-like protein
MELATGVSAVLELAHPEIEVAPAAGWLDMETNFKGKEGFRAYFEGLEEVFGNVRYELLEIEDHGDALLADIVVHVRGRESGATSSVPAFQVLWFEDGLVRRIVGFTERDEALRSLDN